jgi:hypothetical protein
MKFSFFILMILVFAFSSCKKQADSYTCSCLFTFQGSQVTKINVHAASINDAKDTCISYSSPNDYCNLEQ